MRLVALSLLLLPAASQAAEDGKAAFKLHCSACHGTEETGKSTLPTARNLFTDTLLNHPETKAGIIEMINTGNIQKGMAPLKHLPEPTKDAIASYLVELRQAKGIGAKAEAANDEAAGATTGDAGPAAAETEPAAAEAASPAAEAAPAQEVKVKKTLSLDQAMALELQGKAEGPLNVYTSQGLVDGLNVFGLGQNEPAIPATVSPEPPPADEEAEASEDENGD